MGAWEVSGQAAAASAGARRGAGVGAAEEVQVEAGPEGEREGELPGEVQEVLGEAVEVPGERSVVRETPRPELGGVEEFDVEEDQGDVEEDGRERRPAEVLEASPQGYAGHGEEEGAQEDEVEVEVGHPEPR